MIERIATDKTPINIPVNEWFAFVSHAQDKHITQADLHTSSMLKQINATGTNGLLIVMHPRIDVLNSSTNETTTWTGKTK